jgi:hypothetical protein
VVAFLYWASPNAALRSNFQILKKQAKERERRYSRT